MSSKNTYKRGATLTKIDRVHEDIPMEPLISHKNSPPKSRILNNGVPYWDRQRRTSGQTSPAQNILIKRSILPLQFKELCLHGVSLTFSIGIISLCVKRVYFDDIVAPNINAKLNAFQFVAALHGALVGLSLGTMAINHMLYELCRNEGLPLGYLALPFQLSSISIPFRSRFWAALFHKVDNPRKVLFGISIVMAVILQALIGPSSAILIVPQLEFWDYDNPFGNTDGFTFFNQSHDFMWPSYINASLVSPQCNETGLLMPKQCPYANMAQIRNWGTDYHYQFSTSNITSADDGNQIRYISSSPVDDRYIGYSVSTTAMSHVARDFGTIWTYANRYRSDQIPFSGFGRPKLLLRPSSSEKQVMCPLVQAQCAIPVDITNSTNENLKVVFPGNHLRGKGDQTFGNVSAIVNATHFMDKPVVAQFINLSTEAGIPALGFLFSLRFRNARQGFGQNFSSDDGTGLFACSVAAHWIPTNLTSDPRTSNIITLDHSLPEIAVNDVKLMSQSIPLVFDPAYLEKVNIEVTHENLNVLEYNTVGLAALWTQNQKYEGAWGYRWSWILSTLTTMQLSDALSRVNLDSRMMVFCQGCADKSSTTRNEVHDLTIQNSVSNTHPEPRDADEFKADIVGQPDQFVPVQWRVQRYGYGWGLNHTTQWLAMAVILTHLVLVIVHVILSVIRRTEFEAWTDLPEFVALINRSPALGVMHDLGIGVVDDKKYADNVAIRVLKSGNDEQIILTTRDGLGKVEADKKYE